MEKLNDHYCENCAGIPDFRTDAKTAFFVSVVEKTLRFVPSEICLMSLILVKKHAMQSGNALSV